MSELGARMRGVTAVVTGAGHGIGAACAARLAAEGARVAALDLDGEAAHQVAASLPTADGGAHLALATDVTEATSVAEAMAAVERWSERVDSLVNVAGGGMAETPFEDGEDAEFERMWQLNFLSVVRVTRAAVPLLRRSDRAAVVTVSSVNGLVALARRTPRRRRR